MIEWLYFVIYTARFSKLNTEKDDDDDDDDNDDDDGSGGGGGGGGDGDGGSSSSSIVMTMMKHLKLSLPSNICGWVCYRCVQSALI